MSKLNLSSVALEENMPQICTRRLLVSYRLGPETYQASLNDHFHHPHHPHPRPERRHLEQYFPLDLQF